MDKLNKVNPTSPGRRFVIKADHSKLYKGKPYAPLVSGSSKTGGRNNQGRLTMRHHGGGHKRRYRAIDFKRDLINVPGRIERIEYDPNRTAHIALVLYKNGQRRYIIAPHEASKDHLIVNGPEAPIKIGSCLPIRNIPLGTILHAVELKPGKGAQIARSAGSFVTLIAREANYATLRLPSSEVRKVSVECTGTIGVASNPRHNLRSLGKAGASRWLGKRPTVRGVAMNPVDHPHGGGEGKTSGGRHPVSPWGKPTKGYKTRRSKHNRLIVERRKK